MSERIHGDDFASVGRGAGASPGQAAGSGIGAAGRPSGEFATLPVLYRTLSAHSSIDAQKEATRRRAKDAAKTAPKTIKVHRLREADVFVAYSTDPKQGLDAAAVARKMQASGPNRLSPPKTNYLLKLLGYIFGGFNSLMWLACILIILTYEPLGGDNPAILNLGVGILIFLVVMVSAFFYAFVDWNASKIMRSIQSLVAQQAIVVREGMEQQVDAADLVPGDIVVLSMGQRVPADVRLIEVSSDLRFDRSLLTGESKLIAGRVEPTDENPLESKNLALSSTFVVRGRGRGVVFETGDNTVIGQIVKMSGQQKAALTPIQREINRFTAIISTVAITFFGISMLVWGAWIQNAYPGYETASVAIANAIGCLTAFVPQGLPVCFALALTIVARRMAARSVLVKNLSTIETLGCMSVLCSDKTGTLTMGRMFVQTALFSDRSIQLGSGGGISGTTTDATSTTTEVTQSLSVLSDPGASRANAAASDPTDAGVDAGSSPAGTAGAGDARRPSALIALHTIASICNDASFLPGHENQPIEDRPINGDATDAAILRFAETYRPSVGVMSAAMRADPAYPGAKGYSVLFSMAFNSKNKFMAKIVRFGSAPTAAAADSAVNNDIVLFVKGAPDILMQACHDTLRFDGTSVGLSEEMPKSGAEDVPKSGAEDQPKSGAKDVPKSGAEDVPKSGAEDEPKGPGVTYQARMASIQERASGQGLRVLALCRRSLRGIALPLGNQDELEKMVVNELMRDLTLVGLLGICDPPRPDVPPAVRAMRTAGVRVFMVTGDFELTAASIARQVGIVTSATLNRLADVPELRKTYRIGNGLPAAASKASFPQAVLDRVSRFPGAIKSLWSRTESLGGSGSSGSSKVIAMRDMAARDAAPPAATSGDGDMDAPPKSILKTTNRDEAAAVTSAGIDYLANADYRLEDCRPKAEDPARAIVINGSEIGSIGDPDWDFIAAYFSEMVFARTTPEQKMLIVEKLKARGDNIVAVTGDGTNDAPALKAADIGVAMGSGTDVAKEAASMILLNSDFSSILVGIENGRLVFENLRKVVLYLMPAGSYGEFMAVITSVFFGMQIPLSSFQQVLFCVTNDVFMSISLMYENVESKLMTRPPRNARTDRLTDWRFFFQVYFISGVGIWLPAMGMWFMFMSERGLKFYDLMFAYSNWGDGWAGKTLDELAADVSAGQCVYFVTMAICQFGTLLSIRNRRVSILQSNPLWGKRKNLVIFVSMIASVLVCVVIFYGYWIQFVFATAPIPAKYWFIPLGFAAAIVAFDDARKAVVRAYPKSFVAWIAW